MESHTPAHKLTRACSFLLHFQLVQLSVAQLLIIDMHWLGKQCRKAVYTEILGVLHAAVFYVCA